MLYSESSFCSSWGGREHHLSFGHDGRSQPSGAGKCLKGTERGQVERCGTAFDSLGCLALTTIFLDLPRLD